MLTTLAILATFAVSSVAVTFGFLEARGFVRRRLRFVDAIQNPIAPILAGLGAAAVAMPVVWIVPFIGAGTAILFGAAVGTGVFKGAQDIRKGFYLNG